MGRALAVSVLVCWAAVAAAQQTCFGPGDINADSQVNAADWLAFETCLVGPDVTVPPPGCDPEQFDRADLSGDGDVDLPDLAALMPLLGRAYFDYGPHRDNLEAEMLAMDLRQMLRAQEADYQRVLRDLALIRAAYPKLKDVIDDTDWVPKELLLKLVAGQPTAGYQALNRFYQVVREQVQSWGIKLTFCDNLNAEVLALEYEALPEVQWAEPNHLIGIDDYITVTDLGERWQYWIDDGFMDCFDGCDCHREWILQVDTVGTVYLISYREWGQPWCEFGRDAGP
ncbi:MAG: dockerin type I domain-containing protein [Planctomycetota bacterium]